MSAAYHGDMVSILFFPPFPLIILAICNCVILTRSKDVACTKAADFNCDFDAGLERCPCWSNERRFEWKIGQRVPYDAWHSIPRARSYPNDSFAFAQREGFMFSLQGFQASLVSREIACLPAAINLTFWYWKTAVIPKLLFCTQQTDYETEICHLEIFGFQPHAWVRASVSVPPQAKPFKMKLKAVNIHIVYDIVGLDQIELHSYSDQICENQQCVDCNDFSKCSFYSRNGTWIAEVDTTCTQQNCVTGTVAMVRGPGVHTLQMKIPPSVELPLLLQFYHLISANVTSNATLQVCVNSALRCFYSKRAHSSPTFNKKWQQETLTIDVGASTILFIVSDLSTNEKIGIDDIQILSTAGTRLCDRDGSVKP